ncbi:NAD-dependent epimerase/dehydratase family protein [Pseudomonas otitidis]|uniref:NAD-dependent epimerase/dehydratase family protein n=1 Tax=Metapseudomonas otitidis TaxID=319939 RepID=UPI0024487F12|nr:NAD-dependent epimerase/dehydratase family protein [Pseudomonas otitidis]MDH1109317.1 NAD-dependent epimerase/dehydratase family protein [Pseudomonas otitidis]MDH1157568.1 NAD-dependent epimerase/dehydratase family protein [Pseudomonas otitidis]MDH1166326.1 NAD-dependent epimerase/dehydratase family protein [Pseudomonas otitidis]
MAERTKVLVTGATGFIGSGLVMHLAADSRWWVVGSVRSQSLSPAKGVDVFPVGNIGPDTDWSEALSGVGVVVHTAAVAHVRNIGAGERLARLRTTNVDGALCLAKQALAAGVRRFVFISSIGVNGTGIAHQPFNELSLPEPHAAYAVSKLDAERALQELFAGTTTELVIIRPPLVYAAHAPGNFKWLLRVVDWGLPLPFAQVANSRSIIALENLIDIICCCLTHPAAANELFVVEDGSPVSTADMVRHLARGMGKRGRLFSFPVALIALVSRTLGAGGIYTQLFESLIVDGSKARRLLGWRPPLTTESGLIQTGRVYRQMCVSKKD